MSELIPFDYSDLPSDVKGKLIWFEGQIQKTLASHVASGIEMGKWLAGIRELLGTETSFRGWLASKRICSRSSAYNYIAAFEHFGECPNFGHIELSAMYELAKNERAKQKAIALADKGETVNHEKAKELVAKFTTKPPRLPAQKVEDAEFTVVSSAENKRTPVDEDSPEAASEEESGEDDRTEARDTEAPQETASRPTRNVKERKPAPGDVPCANCSNRRWTQGISSWHCTKCGHPHGECRGDADDDEVVDERITTKKAKARKTIEALMREWDDLQVLVPNPKEHAEVISMCKIMLNKLKNWN